MKKNLLIASFTGLSILFACNSNTNSHNATDDTSDHATHNHSSNSMEQKNHMTAIHEAMNQMMQQMHNTQPTGDADYDFAILMKLHHLSAVDMARALVDGGTDPAIKQHAQHTINEQQKEIAAFDKFLQSNKPSDSNSDYGQRAMKMMSHMDHGQMEAGSLEKMYASMMIPHHQAGVKMAEEYLKVASNPELKEIAESIIQTQPKEIEDYKKWLSDDK